MLSIAFSFFKHRCLIGDPCDRVMPLLSTYLLFELCHPQALVRPNQ
jgi:hypothetical protein